MKGIYFEFKCINKMFRINECMCMMQCCFWFQGFDFGNFMKYVKEIEGRKRICDSRRVIYLF